MNKRKNIILFLVSVLAILGILSFSRRMLKPDLREFVNQNKENLSNISNELLESVDNKIEIYEGKGERPNIQNVELIYDNLSLHDMAVEKYKEFYGEEYVDRVIMFLNDKQDDEEYFQCGIYYSPEGCTIDYYGHPVDDIEGVYIYDGRPKRVKIMYKSEKICDNWYYFEDAVW